jgi:RNA polymerase sigma-70 factor, ECF subfamily
MRDGSRTSTNLSVLARAQSGDDDAWRRLVELYGPLVHAWCRREGLNGPELEDVFQDVFLTVATRLATFRHDRSGDTFRGWLRLITRSKFVDHVRRSPPARAAGGSEALGRLQCVAAPCPQAAIDGDDASEQRLLASRALDLLKSQFDDRTWQAFWRTTVESATSAVVASELGMTANAVRKAKVRVLQKLRAEFGEVLI